MKFENIDAIVIAELEIRMKDEIADYLEDYCYKNDIDMSNINEEIFNEAMEDFWSDIWVNFLDKFNTEAMYEVSYNEKDGIEIEFMEV